MWRPPLADRRRGTLRASARGTSSRRRACPVSPGQCQPFRRQIEPERRCRSVSVEKHTCRRWTVKFRHQFRVDHHGNHRRRLHSGVVSLHFTTARRRVRNRTQARRSTRGGRDNNPIHTTELQPPCRTDRRSTSSPRSPADHTVVPVYRRLTGDTLTPVSAFCKLQEGDWSFLFESVVGGERVGRYSFLGAGPFRTFEAHGTHTRTRDGQRQVESRPTSPDPAARHSETSWSRSSARRHVRRPAAVLRRRSRVRRVRHRALRRAPARTPRRTTAASARPELRPFHDRMVIFDHAAKTVLVVAHCPRQSGDRRIGDPGIGKQHLRAACRGACARRR